MSNTNNKKTTNIPNTSTQNNSKPLNPPPPSRLPCPIHKNVQPQKNTANNTPKPNPTSKITTSTQPKPPPRPKPLISPENAMLQHLKTEDRLTKLETEIETSRRQEKLRKIQMYEKLKELSSRQLELHKQITLRAESKKNKSPADSRGNSDVIKTDAELRELMHGISESLQKLQKQLQSPSKQCAVHSGTANFGSSVNSKLENRIRNLEEKIEANKRLEREVAQSKPSTQVILPVRKSIDRSKPRSLDALAKKPLESIKKSSSLEKFPSKKLNQNPSRNYSHKDIQQIIIKLAISLDNLSKFDKLKTELIYDQSKDAQENDDWQKLETQKNLLNQIISAEGFEQFELITDYLNAIHQKKIDQQFRLEMERSLEQKWYIKEQLNKRAGSPDKEKKSVWLERERVVYLENASNKKHALPAIDAQSKSLQDLSWEWMHREKDQSHNNLRPDEEIALDLLRLLEQEERILIDEIDKGKWKLTEKEASICLDERIKNRLDLLEKKWSSENHDLISEKKKARNVRKELEQENSKLNRIKIALGKSYRDSELVLYYEKKLKSINTPMEMTPAKTEPQSAENTQSSEANKVIEMERKLLQQVSEERRKKEARSAEILQLIQKLEDELNQMRQEDHEWKQQIQQEFIKTHDLRKKMEKQRLMDIAEVEKRKEELKAAEEKLKSEPLVRKEEEIKPTLETIPEQLTQKSEKFHQVCEICEIEKIKYNKVLNMTSNNQNCLINNTKSNPVCSVDKNNCSSTKGCNKPLCDCADCNASRLNEKNSKTQGTNTDPKTTQIDLETQRVELIENILTNLVSKKVVQPSSSQLNQPQSTTRAQVPLNETQSVIPIIITNEPECHICEQLRLEAEVLCATESRVTEIIQSDKALQQQTFPDLKDGEKACQTSNENISISIKYNASKNAITISEEVSPSPTVCGRREEILFTPERVPMGYNAKPSQPHVRTWFHRHVPTGESEESIENQQNKRK